MAIRFDDNKPDAQDLPVVSWVEDRNLFAPGSGGPARVTCFIRPDEEGVLQFVAAGSVRHGNSWRRGPGSGWSLSSEARRITLLFGARPGSAGMARDKGKTGIARMATTDGAW